MQASDMGNADDIVELVIIVIFLILGITNTTIYVQWCSANIFGDNIVDKVKYTVNVEQKDLAQIDDMELTGEQVVFMTRFKSNNYNQKTPSLIVQPVAGISKTAMFLPEPETTWKNYIINNMKTKYADMVVPGQLYTLNLDYLNPSSHTIRHLNDGSPVVITPVEVAVTSETGAPRSNPAYGRNGIIYVDDQTPDGWFAWQVLPK